MSSSAPCPPATLLQTPRSRGPREVDVQRFVTPLSYRMKKNKENAEDESQSTGIDDASDEDSILTASKSAARMITPLELCRRNDAQRTASAKAKPKASQRPSSTNRVQGAKVAHAEAARAPNFTTDSPAKASRPPKGACNTSIVQGQRKMRATVVPPPSASLVVPDLSASLASPRGAYTVAVPIATNRSSSPPVPIGRVDGGYRDNGCLVKSVPVPMARTSATPTATVVTDKASSTPQRTVQLGRRSFAQSCSVPSLLSPRASIVAPSSAEVVPSLAQIVIQQLNTPSRQARSSACPQTARCGTATTAQRPRLAELKPLLKDLFEEQAEAQDAQQLQSKIDQLQKLQQILQMQQEGLKQQQKVAQSYQPKVQRLSEYHPPARGYSASMTSPRGLEVPSMSPRARSSQACRRRFLV